MLLEIYLLMQLMVFVIFFISYFTKQELLWVFTLVLSGVLMMTSSTIEISGYTYDLNSSIYTQTITTQYYPYLIGINLLLFALSLLFAIYDIYTKYNDGGNVKLGFNQK